jgi:hypothetical protein
VRGILAKTMQCQMRVCKRFNPVSRIYQSISEDLR